MPDDRPPTDPRDTSLTEAELLAEGWERRFVADEPRLSESIELYASLGFEVVLRPLGDAELSGEDCAECFKKDPARYRILYTRRT